MTSLVITVYIRSIAVGLVASAFGFKFKNDEDNDRMTRTTRKPEDKRQQLQSAIDSIDVVRTWTWPYDDLPGDIGRRLGVNARHRFYSDHGGNKPAKLFDLAARRISKGETKVAVVTGGEALASLTTCAAAKKLPPPGWTKTKQGVDAVFSPTGRDLGKDLGAVHSIGAPIQVYPLFENGFRAHRHQSRYCRAGGHGHGTQPLP